MFQVLFVSKICLEVEQNGFWFWVLTLVRRTFNLWVYYNHICLFTVILKKQNTQFVSNNNSSTINKYIATISVNKYEYSALVSVRLLFDPKWLLYYFHSLTRTILLLTLSRSTWDHLRWAYPLPEHMRSSPLFYSGAHIAKYLLVLCSSILSPITLFVFCHFSFGHCIVCPSLWLLITPLLSFGHCIVCPSLRLLITPLLSFGHGIVCPSLRLLITPLLSFGHCIVCPPLRHLITPLLSFGHCIVCPPLYGFWLHLCYLLAIVLYILPYMASDYTFGIFKLF
jgi:hypothetical protein